MDDTMIFIIGITIGFLMGVTVMWWTELDDEEKQ